MKRKYICLTCRNLITNMTLHNQQYGHNEFKPFKGEEE